MQIKPKHNFHTCSPYLYHSAMHSGWIWIGNWLRLVRWCCTVDVLLSSLTPNTPWSPSLSLTHTLSPSVQWFVVGLHGVHFNCRLVCQHQQRPSRVNGRWWRGERKRQRAKEGQPVRRRGEKGASQLSWYRSMLLIYGLMKAQLYILKYVGLLSLSAIVGSD